MHFSFWEKSGFALLIAAWVVWGSNQIGNTLVQAEELAENAYKIEVAEKDDGDAVLLASAPVEESVLVLMASASVEKGEKAAKKCLGCHSLKKGGANKVGPNLWNVVGRNQGAAKGYAYSDALLSLGTTWTYENFNDFLKNPKEYAPGTKMSFALKKASDRANVILYLRENSDNPLPLP